MAKLLFIFLLLVVVVIGVGFYLGWFHLSSTQNNGNPAYTVTVDQEKVKEDKARAKKKLQELEHKVTERVAPATQP